MFLIWYYLQWVPYLKRNIICSHTAWKTLYVISNKKKKETLFNNDELKEHPDDEIAVAYKISFLFHF